MIPKTCTAPRPPIASANPFADCLVRDQRRLRSLARDLRHLFGSKREALQAESERPKTVEIWRRQKIGHEIAGLEPGQGRATARRSEPLTRRRDGYAGGMAVSAAFREGVELSIAQRVFEQIAEIAIEYKTGARSLRSIFEELITPILYVVPDKPETCKVEITSLFEDARFFRKR